MKVLVTLFISCLFGLLVVGCGDSSSVPCVIEITDVASDDSLPIKLSYDRKGRLVSFAEATVSYEKNKIIVDGLKEMLGYGNFFTMTFNLDDGRVVSSEAHCKELLFGKMTEVNKKSTYSYTDNKIIVDSKSFDFKSNKLLKTFREVRELSDDGKLVKMISVDSDCGSSVSLYKYDSNITCSANINLQAFTFPANGMDQLFIYLLNLVKIPQINVLPDEINYTYPDGSTHLYNENCCLDGDRLTRLEIMMNYEILIARLNFEYSKSNI